MSALSLLLEPADPASEGLVVGGGQKLANQLYLQRGKDLLTAGQSIFRGAICALGASKREGQLPALRL